MNSLNYRSLAAACILAALSLAWPQSSRAADPVGVFNSIDETTAIASGSATDADRPGQSIELHVYMGTGFNYFVAQAWTQPSTTSFSFQIPAQYRDGVSRSFCAYAINDGGVGAHPQLGCQEFTQANFPPTGTISSINAAGLVSGTASDANRPGQSIAVHFYLGTNLSTFLGGATTQASNGAFTFQVPEQYRGGQSQTICAWAINEAGVHPRVDCKPTVTNTGGSGPSSVTRNYVYDSHQRLCKTVNPESLATIIEYDAAGNIHWTADGTSLTGPGCNRENVAETAKTYRTYDPMNRITRVTTPYGEGDITTTYTPDGLVESSTANNIGNVTAINGYTYNKRRLLVAETSSQPGWYTFGVEYRYNANGHPSSLAYPYGLVLQYSPNALGQPTQVGDFAYGISYYPNGAVKRFTYGSGLVHAMTQNARGLPARSQVFFYSSPMLDDSYSFDANGNVTDIVDQAKGTARGMAYDGLDRLTTAVSTGTQTAPMWGTAQYTYDAQDNLRTSTLGISGYAYGYDSNNRLATLARSGGGVYAYSTSPRGNVTHDGRQEYVWDSVNRLYAVNGKEYYRYDSLGRRVLSWRPIGSGAISLFMYGKSGQILHVDDGLRGQRTSNIYLGNTLLATRSVVHATGAEVIRYQHNDALGSPVLTTNIYGFEEERTVYAPYGAPVNRPLEGVGYTGHYMDQTTGLTYMQQRYYDPQIGRFLSVDPVASRETGDNFNRYWYANNNPYRFTDPDGRETGAGYASGQYTMSGSSVSSPEAYQAAGILAGMVYGGGALPAAVRTMIAAARLLGALFRKPETKGPDFIVSRDGAVVPATPGAARQSLEKAGFPGRDVANRGQTETGTVHTIPGQKMDVRVMDGGPNHPPRVVTTREGTSQPVNPSNGANFGNVPKAEQRQRSHIELQKK